VTEKIISKGGIMKQATKKIVASMLISFIFVIMVVTAIKAQAYATEPIKIAAIFAQTGIAGEDNKRFVQGVKLTVDAINKGGGVLKRQLQLITIDTKSTPIDSMMAAEKAVEENVSAVIGAAWSSHSLQIAQVLQNAGIPMITPSSTNPDVTKTGNYIFRACFDDETQGNALAHFAYNNIKARTAVILTNIDEEYSISLSNFFHSFFKSSGGKILCKENYRNTSVDFSLQLSKVQKHNPNLVFIPGYDKDAGFIIKQARKKGIKTIFLGGDGLGIDTIAYGGKALEGTFYSGHWHSGISSSANLHLQKICRESAYDNKIMAPQIATSYDAVLLLVNAIQRAGSTEHHKIRNALAETKNFKGATGTITFDKYGDPINKEVNILKFEKDSQVFVHSIIPEKIRVASIFAHTGKAAKSNKHSIEGVRIAIDEINSRGGVFGKKFELIELDNKSTPIGSKNAAQKAVEQHITAIIGCQWSSHSIAAGGVAQSAKIPMISNISTNEKVSRIGDYIFRVCFTDEFQGEVMAKFARKDLKASNAVMLIDMTSDYSIGLGDEFNKSFKKLNGNILLELPYKRGQEDFEKIFSKIVQLKPDTLFIPGHDESTTIVRKAMEAGIRAVPLGGDGWRVYDNDKKIKDAYFCAHWSEDVDTDISQNFVKTYENDYHLLSQTALSYDAVLLLADAIQRAGSIKRAKIRNAIANTENFKGITGTISFNSYGDPIKSAVVMKIENGTVKYQKSIDP
jgi:branched-chain amino acid transport system substrate-binding protein